MNKNSTRKRYTSFGNLVCGICFITNLSQTPFFVEAGITRFVSIPVWLFLGCICLIKKPSLYVGKIKAQLVITGMFAIYYGVGGLFISNYLESDLPYAIFLSIFVLIIGVMSGCHFKEDDLEHIMSYYIFSGCIVCLNVYSNYIYGQSLDGRMYLYSSKNSVSQILLTTWILILLLKFNGIGFLKKAMYFIILLFLTWTMLALKSRATIIAMPVVVAWVLLHKNLNKKVKNIIIVICFGFALLMLNNEIYDFVLNDILFSGRDATDLNALTSGRSDEWVRFPKEFWEHWFFGQGREKRESLILTSLLEFGIIGGGMILVLATSPIAWGIKNSKRNPMVYLIFTSIALAYFLNGIFEQLAPFGPGVKCYFLWFLLGILATDNWINERNVFVGENRYGL